ncbi:MAG TPA: MopE-related protein [Candidatus Nanoarchaeia archaeon]|nr:MopE-related protein [Candidatus Nanoarchaeia archaeon]
MARKIRILLLVSLITIISAFSASAADCGNGIKDCECGDTVVADYTFSSDLVCDGSSGPVSGLVVGSDVQLSCAPDVKIECAPGVKDGGSCETGISISASNDISITGCTIIGWDRGVRIGSGSSNINITLNKILHNIQGILVTGAGNNITISYNTVSGNGVESSPGEGGVLGNCGDGIDNDADTQVDCADSECSFDVLCGGPGQGYFGGSIMVLTVHGQDNIQIIGNTINDTFVFENRGAIHIGGSNGNISNLVISNNTIYNVPLFPGISFSFVGIINLTISNNSLTNVGIGLGFGFAAPVENGIISGNSVTCSGLSATLGDIGMMVAGTADVTGNMVNDCDIGIFATFAGLAPGFVPSPISIDANTVTSNFGTGICTDIAFATLENNVISNGIIGIADLLEEFDPGNWQSGITILFNSYAAVQKEICRVRSPLVGGCLQFAEDALAGTVNLDALCGTGEPPFFCPIQFNFIVGGQLYDAPGGVVYVFKESEAQACGIDTSDGVQDYESGLPFGCQAITQTWTCNGIAGGTCSITLGDPGPAGYVAIAFDHPPGSQPPPSVAGAAVFGESLCGGQVDINEFGGETNCGDGIDNDNDGRIDCQDGDCQGSPSCPGCVVTMNWVDENQQPVNAPYGNILLLSYDEINNDCGIDLSQGVTTDIFQVFGNPCITQVQICGLFSGESLSDGQCVSQVNIAAGDQIVAVAIGSFGAEEIQSVQDSCENGLDDDGNNLVDCADPACAPARNCGPSNSLVGGGIFGPQACGGSATIGPLGGPEGCPLTFTAFGENNNPVPDGSYIFTLETAVISTIPYESPQGSGNFILIDPSDGIDFDEWFGLLIAAQNGPPPGLDGGCISPQGQPIPTSGGTCQGSLGELFPGNPNAPHTVVVLYDDFMNPTQIISQNYNFLTCGGQVIIGESGPEVGDCTITYSFVDGQSQPIDAPNGGVVIFSQNALQACVGTFPPPEPGEEDCNAIFNPSDGVMGGEIRCAFTCPGANVGTCPINLFQGTPGIPGGSCTSTILGSASPDYMIAIALDTFSGPPSLFGTATFTDAECGTEIIPGQVTIVAVGGPPPGALQVLVLEGSNPPVSPPGAIVLAFDATQLEAFLGTAVPYDLSPTQMQNLFADLDLGPGAGQSGFIGGCFGEQGPSPTGANGMCDLSLFFGDPTGPVVVLAFLNLDFQAPDPNFIKTRGVYIDGPPPSPITIIFPALNLFVESVTAASPMVSVTAGATDDTIAYLTLFDGSPFAGAIRIETRAVALRVNAPITEVFEVPDSPSTTGGSLHAFFAQVSPINDLFPQDNVKAEVRPSILASVTSSSSTKSNSVRDFSFTTSVDDYVPSAADSLVIIVPDFGKSKADYSAIAEKLAQSEKRVFVIDPVGYKGTTSTVTTSDPLFKGNNLRKWKEKDRLLPISAQLCALIPQLKAETGLASATIIGDGMGGAIVNTPELVCSAQANALVSTGAYCKPVTFSEGGPKSAVPYFNLKDGKTPCELPPSSVPSLVLQGDEEKPQGDLWFFKFKNKKPVTYGLIQGAQDSFITNSFAGTPEFDNAEIYIKSFIEKETGGAYTQLENDLNLRPELVHLLLEDVRANDDAVKPKDTLVSNDGFNLFAIESADLSSTPTGWAVGSVVDIEDVKDDFANFMTNALKISAGEATQKVFVKGSFENPDSGQLVLNYKVLAPSTNPVDSSAKLRLDFKDMQGNSLACIEFHSTNLPVSSTCSFAIAVSSGNDGRIQEISNIPVSEILKSVGAFTTKIFSVDIEISSDSPFYYDDVELLLEEDVLEVNEADFLDLTSHTATFTSPIININAGEQLTSILPLFVAEDGASITADVLDEFDIPIISGIELNSAANLMAFHETLKGLDSLKVRFNLDPGVTLYKYYVVAKPVDVFDTNINGVEVNSLLLDEQGSHSDYSVAFNLNNPGDFDLISAGETLSSDAISFGVGEIYNRVVKTDNSITRSDANNGITETDVSSSSGTVDSFITLFDSSVDTITQDINFGAGCHVEVDDVVMTSAFTTNKLIDIVCPNEEFTLTPFYGASNIELNEVKVDPVDATKDTVGDLDKLEVRDDSALTKTAGESVLEEGYDFSLLQDFLQNDIYQFLLDNGINDSLTQFFKNQLDKSADGVLKRDQVLETAFLGLLGGDNNFSTIMDTEVQFTATGIRLITRTQGNSILSRTIGISSSLNSDRFSIKGPGLAEGKCTSTRAIVLESSLITPKGLSVSDCVDIFVRGESKDLAQDVNSIDQLAKEAVSPRLDKEMVDTVLDSAKDNVTPRRGVISIGGSFDMRDSTISALDDLGFIGISVAGNSFVENSEVLDFQYFQSSAGCNFIGSVFESSAIDLLEEENRNAAENRNSEQLDFARQFHGVSCSSVDTGPANALDQSPSGNYKPSDVATSSVAEATLKIFEMDDPCVLSVAEGGSVCDKVLADLNARDVPITIRSFGEAADQLNLADIAFNQDLTNIKVSEIGKIPSSLSSITFKGIPLDQIMATDILDEINNNQKIDEVNAIRTNIENTGIDNNADELLTEGEEIAQPGLLDANLAPVSYSGLMVETPVEDLDVCLLSLPDGTGICDVRIDQDTIIEDLGITLCGLKRNGVSICNIITDDLNDNPTLDTVGYEAEYQVSKNGDVDVSELSLGDLAIGDRGDSVPFTALDTSINNVKFCDLQLEGVSVCNVVAGKTAVEQATDFTGLDAFDIIQKLENIPDIRESDYTGSFDYLMENLNFCANYAGYIDAELRKENNLDYLRVDKSFKFGNVAKLHIDGMCSVQLDQTSLCDLEGNDVYGPVIQNSAAISDSCNNAAGDFGSCVTNLKELNSCQLTIGGVSVCSVEVSKGLINDQTVYAGFNITKLQINGLCALAYKGISICDTSIDKVFNFTESQGTLEAATGEELISACDLTFNGINLCSGHQFDDEFCDQAKIDGVSVCNSRWDNRLVDDELITEAAQGQVFNDARDGGTFGDEQKQRLLRPSVCDLEINGTTLCDAVALVTFTNTVLPGESPADFVLDHTVLEFVSMDETKVNLLLIELGEKCNELFINVTDIINKTIPNIEHKGVPLSEMTLCDDVEINGLSLCDANLVLINDSDILDVVLNGDVVGQMDLRALLTNLVFALTYDVGGETFNDATGTIGDILDLREVRLGSSNLLDNVLLSSNSIRNSEVDVLTRLFMDYSIGTLSKPQRTLTFDNKKAIEVLDITLNSYDQFNLDCAIAKEIQSKVDLEGTEIDSPISKVELCDVFGIPTPLSNAQFGISSYSPPIGSLKEGSLTVNLNSVEFSDFTLETLYNLTEFDSETCDIHNNEFTDAAVSINCELSATGNNFFGKDLSDGGDLILGSPGALVVAVPDDDDKVEISGNRFNFNHMGGPGLVGAAEVDVSKNDFVDPLFNAQYITDSRNYLEQFIVKENLDTVDINDNVLVDRVESRISRDEAKELANTADKYNLVDDRYADLASDRSEIAELNRALSQLNDIDIESIQLTNEIADMFGIDISRVETLLNRELTPIDISNLDVDNTLNIERNYYRGFNSVRAYLPELIIPGNLNFATETSVFIYPKKRVSFVGNAIVDNPPIKIKSKEAIDISKVLLLNNFRAGCEIDDAAGMRNCADVELSTMAEPPEISGATAASLDRDEDTVPNHVDNCPFTPNTGQEDTDFDTLGDMCDNCDDFNPDQFDRDLDGIGDVCDNDRDGDGIANPADACPNAFDPGNSAEICSGCVDLDADTFYAFDADECTGGNDCDDSNAAANIFRLEACNNLDDNCNGQTDESVLQRCGASDVGECTFGVEACSAGSYIGCTAILPTAEVCDGLDNDCDAIVDEGIAPQQCEVTDAGECRFGLRSCEGGAFSSCVGNIDPVAEICDSLDNDCDGQADESAAGGDLTEVCGTDVGACQTGVRTCSAGGFGVCVGEIAPVGETSLACNNIDDNCNGVIDDGYDRDDDGFTSCDTPKPDCNDNDRSINPDAPERCNDGIDNNCDGKVDFGDTVNCPAADKVSVELHTIDQAKTNYCGAGRGSCKEPIQGARVKVFDRDNADFQSAFTKNPSGTLYDVVYESDIGLIGSCITDSSGSCLAVEQGAGTYLVIIKYVDEETNSNIYVGRPKSPSDFVDVNGDGKRDMATKEIQIIKVLEKGGRITFRGGSKIVVTGSELVVISADNVIWMNDREVYPFIFTSDADWTVDVCMQIPAGYRIEGVLDENGNVVTTANCAQTFVSGEAKVVIFSVVEVGSPEPNFGFTLTTKHNGKTQTAKGTINGIRQKTKTQLQKQISTKVKAAKQEIANRQAKSQTKETASPLTSRAVISRAAMSSATASEPVAPNGNLTFIFAISSIALLVLLLAVIYIYKERAAR